MPMTHWLIIGVCMTAIMTFVFTIPVKNIFSNFLRKKNPKDIFLFQVGEEMEAEARNSLAFADFLVRPSDRGY